jgi:hypothetical protein
MKSFGMMTFNELAAGDVCFSLPGALSVFPVRFSFPAPMFCDSICFSVSARIQSDWQIIQERIEHFFISISGSVRKRFVKHFTAVFRFFRCRVNSFRARTMRLAAGGLRL